MNFKSKKGYSLIEIAVGILILTIFLVCSAALFNGAYNTYRMIQQRNLATNRAITNMENMLQKDPNILTGFFTESYDATTGEYNKDISSEFMSFVKDNFDGDIKARYAALNGVTPESVGEVSDDKYSDYIYADTNYLVGAYIKDVVEGYSNAEFDSEEVQNGDYAFIKENVEETGNLALINPGSVSAEALKNYIGDTMAVRTTVLRLPISKDNAYGNNILKLKVEVFYTDKIDLTKLTKEDVKVITLESVKLSK